MHMFVQYLLYVVYIISNLLLAHATAKIRSSGLPTTDWRDITTQGATSQLQSRPEVERSLNFEKGVVGPLQWDGFRDGNTGWTSQQKNEEIM